MTRDNRNYLIRVKNENKEIEIEGDKEFVEEKYSQISHFLNIDKPSIETNEITQPKLNLKDMELSQLINQVNKPEQIILAFSYWINKHLKKKEVKQQKILEMYTELKMEAPKNIPYYLRKLEKNNDIVRGSKQGRFKISKQGEKNLLKLIDI
jgi:hypothetical protein